MVMRTMRNVPPLLRMQSRILGRIRLSMMCPRISTSSQATPVFFFPALPGIACKSPSSRRPPALPAEPDKAGFGKSLPNIAMLLYGAGMSQGPPILGQLTQCRGIPAWEGGTSERSPANPTFQSIRRARAKDDIVGCLGPMTIPRRLRTSGLCSVPRSSCQRRWSSGQVRNPRRPMSFGSMK